MPKASNENVSGSRSDILSPIQPLAASARPVPAAPVVIREQPAAALLTPIPAPPKVPQHIPALVSAEPDRLPPRPVSTPLTRHAIGSEPDAVPLQTPGWTRSVGEKRRIERPLDPLPELDVDISARPLSRQPAFLVSMTLAVIALLGVGGWWVRNQFFSPPDAVETITLLDAGDNYRLEWRGPDVPYTVLVVHDDGQVQGDVSGWVRDWALYMPKDYPELAADSCFVVQPATVTITGTAIDVGGLSASGGAMTCIADMSTEDG